MTRARIITALAFLVGLIFVIYQASSRQDSSDQSAFEKLKQRQTRNETLQTDQAMRDAFDVAKLAEEGKGVKLPPYLVSKLDDTGDFWFVGKPGSPTGVEIPFRPGGLRKPPTSTSQQRESGPSGFLGASACKECHPKEHDSFIHTAHYRTSRKADLGNISGSLDSGTNRMNTKFEDVYFEMLARDDSAYQRVHYFGWEFEVPFDLIIGSSKMAETYLYWHADSLYQMNTTYLSTKDQWINSPGYIDGDAAYARPIGPECIECHSTYVDYLGPPNRFDAGSLILGVTCERCHGPGRAHVEFHREHQDAKVAQHIVVATKLPREEELDVCGQCHTGNKHLRDGTPFQFRRVTPSTINTS